VRSEPLTHERVVAEILRAIRAICISFPGRELNGGTNLALDLGLESVPRVELLAEVERTLDVALDVGEVAVFAELTIAERRLYYVDTPRRQYRPIKEPSLSTVIARYSRVSRPD
jgi:Phosphopantetheine attachment site